MQYVRIYRDFSFLTSDSFGIRHEFLASYNFPILLAVNYRSDAVHIGDSDCAREQDSTDFLDQCLVDLIVHPRAHPHANRDSTSLIVVAVSLVNTQSVV